MAPTTPITGSQCGIKFTATTNDYKIEVKQDKDGFINVTGHNVKVELPANTASRIRFYGDNIEVQDGAETDGKKYSDDIELYGEKIQYASAQRLVNGKPAKPSDKPDGDIIDMYGKTDFVKGHVGDRISIKPGSEMPLVETNGALIRDQRNGGENLSVIKWPTDSVQDKQVKDNLFKGFALGFLTLGIPKTIKQVAKVGLTPQLIVNTETQEKVTGTEPTYGEIKKAYNLPAGVLKNANDLYFSPGDMDANNTTNLDDCKASKRWDGVPEVVIPKDTMKAKGYFTDISKK